MKKCPNCGNLVSEDSKYCDHCGRDLRMQSDKIESSILDFQDILPLEELTKMQRDLSPRGKELFLDWLRKARTTKVDAVNTTDEITLIGKPLFDYYGSIVQYATFHSRHAREKSNENFGERYADASTKCFDIGRDYYNGKLTVDRARHLSEKAFTPVCDFLFDLAVSISKRGIIPQTEAGMVLWKSREMSGEIAKDIVARGIQFEDQKGRA